MADRVVAVIALAGALLIALAASGTFSAPPSQALGASQYQYCEYGMDEYGNCLPPPTDGTPPTIAAVQSPAQNTNGWNNTNVMLTLTAADEPGGSGVASITCQIAANTPTTTPGAIRVLTFTDVTVNEPVTCRATDMAGNTSAPLLRTVRIDRIPPTIAFQSQSPAPNGFGWNNTNVTLNWSCSDGFSGVVSTIVVSTVTTDGFGQSRSGTCTDRAGNTATNVRSGINIDKTPPAIAFAGQVPTPNGFGWNNRPVTLNWTCSDSLSGVVPALSMTSIPISLEGANQQGTGTCADFAGNFASNTHGGVNIDTTPPTLTFLGQTPPPNGNASGTFLVLDSQPGDYIGGGIKRTFTRADSTIAALVPPGSDFFSASVNQPGTGENWAVTMGAPPGQPLTVGTYENAVRTPFRPPDVPGLDVFGDGRGCNTIVGRFVVSELTRTLSGDILVFDATFEQHCEGATAALFGRMRIDNSGAGGATAAVNGWNNKDVTLAWSCSDALSGVAPSLIGVPVITTLTQTLTAEGAGQSATGTCLDHAGNTASDTRGGVAIDKTPPNPPAVTADRAPDYAGGGGWYRDAVTVSFAGNGDPDAANGTQGSGVDPASIPSPVTFATDGPHVASGTVADRAGNTSAPGTLAVQVDATPPVVSASFTKADGSEYVPGTWTNEAVTATFSCSDGDGSGVASTSPPVTVSTQGTNQSVTGTCTDNVGKTASQSFSGIDIDLTPPEALVAFDLAHGDVVVTFTDAGGSGVPGGPVAPSAGTVAVAPGSAGKSDRTYSATDGAGNSLSIVLHVKTTPHAVEAVFETLTYNGGRRLDAPDNDLDFSFDTNKDGSVKRLSQNIRVGKGAAAVQVTADYDPKKNETKIHVAGKGGSSSTRPGLVLIRVATNAGALVVQY